MDRLTTTTTDTLATILENQAKMMAMLTGLTNRLTTMEQPPRDKDRHDEGMMIGAMGGMMTDETTDGRTDRKTDGIDRTVSTDGRTAVAKHHQGVLETGMGMLPRYDD